MNIARLSSLSILLLSCALGMSGAHGQSYPNRLVRIVTANPGGGNDLAARVINQPLSAALGQSVIVDNRGGGMGAVTMRAVMKEPPDGYTLLIYSSGLWIAPLIQEAPWDPIKDFTPIVLMATAPNVMVVHPSLPVKSVKDFIAFARARRGQLHYASGQNGAGTHLAAELLNSMAKIDLVRVVYKGTGQGVLATATGEVQVAFPSVGSVAPFLASGKLRPLAITANRPSALLPDLPTMASFGLPGYEAESSYGVFAPAGTPAPIVNRLNAELVKILGRPEIKQRFFRFGIDTVGSTPEELAAKIKADIAFWGKVIKQAGISER